MGTIKLHIINIDYPDGGNHLVYRNVSSEGMKGSDLFLNPLRPINSHRGMIVGLDPGLTVGIAILDLKGNLFHCKL